MTRIEKARITVKENNIQGLLFEFPEKTKLTRFLGDVMDDIVDEKYYLSETMKKGFIKHNEHHKEKGTGFIWKPKGKHSIASCIRARYSSLAPTDTTVDIDNKGE